MPGQPEAAVGDVVVKSLAAAIVIWEDQVLIVRRSFKERFLPGVWGIPCGKLEPGEDPADGVLRELKEETGLAGLVQRLVGMSEFPSQWNGSPVRNLQSNFLVTPLGTDVSLPETDQEFRWVSLGRLDEVDLDDHNLSAIRQVLS